MELTARDINTRRFNDQWRGYNQEEVDDFLDKVAEAIDQVQRENAALRRRVAELEQTVAASKNTEEMLKKTLVTAQQAAEEAIAKARTKAEQLVAEAEERAHAAAEEARERVAELESEARQRAADIERQHGLKKRELDASIERLRGLEGELKQRLRTFLEQQLRSLDALSDKSETRARPSVHVRLPDDANGHEPAPSAAEREDTRPNVPPHPAATEDADGAESPRRTVRSFFGRPEE